MPALATHSRLPPGDDLLFEQIAVALERDGYGIFPAALPLILSESLVQCLADVDAEAFRRAGVGRGSDYVHNQFVRRDRISWIEERTPGAAPWHDWTQRLRLFLNQRLYLGLFSFESHFAIYEPGDFYRTHVDAFRGEANRVLSLVTYLNRGWEPGQGGELVLYDNDEPAAERLRVAPAFGTLVLFLSEEFPHEVLAATRDRVSVAGWFRLNRSDSRQIDPPL